MTVICGIRPWQRIFDATVDPKEQFSEYLLGKCELDQVLKQTEVQAHPMDCIWLKKGGRKAVSSVRIRAVYFADQSVERAV